MQVSLLSFPPPARSFQPLRLRALTTHRRLLLSSSPQPASPLPSATTPDRLHSQAPHYRRRTGSAFKLSKPTLQTALCRAPVRIRSLTPLRIAIREDLGRGGTGQGCASRREGKVTRPRLREVKGESGEVGPWQGEGLELRLN